MDMIRGRITGGDLPQTAVAVGRFTFDHPGGGLINLIAG